MHCKCTAALPCTQQSRQIDVLRLDHERQRIAQAQDGIARQQLSEARVLSQFGSSYIISISGATVLARARL